ncbi:MAG: hypothetical protein M1834_001767 [Cirrosporium novae-zelandiae]|nr:MAG: hypothetical protein M1834_001767 [Cirrosporium novae-zelandiae]
MAGKDELPDAPIKRSRASKPKVKTGCITCKIRRIKCDEGKPSCYRCTSTGRKCDGYAIIPDKRTRALTHVSRRERSNSSSPALSECSCSISCPSHTEQTLTNMFTVSQGTPSERHALEFFQYYTVPAFSGYFESVFWKNLVLRVSSREPAIREAVIAFGALHRGYQYAGLANKSVTKWRQEPSYLFALQHYGKAIHLLTLRMNEQSADSLQLALIFCALCLCFEVMHGSYVEALVHLISGLNLVQQRQMSLSAMTSSPHEIDLKGTDDYITIFKIFNQFDNHASSFMSERPTQLPISANRLNKFETIEQARDQLEILTSAMYVYNRTMAFGLRYKNPDEIPIHVRTRQAQLQESFRQWSQMLDELLEDRKHKLDVRSIKGAMLLKMQHRVSYMNLVWCLARSEGVTAKYFENLFEEIVSYGETLLKTADDDEVPQSIFKAYTGVVYPLYFSAQRCRNPSIRRRAVGALARSTREGTWNGPLLAKIVAKCIEIEEEGIEPGQEIPESKLLHTFHADYRFEDEDRIILNCRRTNDPNFQEWEDFEDVVYLDQTDCPSIAGTQAPSILFPFLLYNIHNCAEPSLGYFLEEYSKRARLLAQDATMT